MPGSMRECGGVGAVDADPGLKRDNMMGTGH
jgi:hypothetical protein